MDQREHKVARKADAGALNSPIKCGKNAWRTGDKFASPLLNVNGHRDQDPLIGEPVPP